MSKVQTEAERAKLPKDEEGGIVVRSLLEKDKVKVSYDSGQTHTILIGTTGSSKTQGVIYPSIFSIGCSDASMVVLDPKGELYAKTNYYLKKKGYKIYTMDYLRPEAGSCFNQLFLVEQEFRENLPHFYIAKACQSIIKTLDFITTGGDVNNFEFFQQVAYNEENDAEYLKENKTPGRIKQVKGKGGNVVLMFEIAKSEDFNNDAILAMRDVTDPKILLNMLNEIYSVVFDQIQKDYLKEQKSSEIDSCIYHNEELKIRAERTVHAVVDVLSTISSNNLIKYYEAKIIINERNMKGKEPESAAYKRCENYIANYKEYIEKLKNGLSIDLIRSYINDLRLDHQAIWNKAETNAVDNAGAIATILIPDNPNAKDSFWDKTARALQKSLILLVCRESEKEKSRHLGSVNRILSKMARALNDKGDTKLTRLSKRLADDDPVRLEMATVDTAPDKTKASIYASAIDATNIFGNKNIVDQAANQDFSPEMLAYEKTAVFLITPGSDDSGTSQYTVLSTLFIEEMYSCLNKITLMNGGGLPRPVYFLLEEMGNIPTIPHLGSKISLARSKNMRFLMVLQSYEQLKEKYKSDENTIRENSNILYLLSNDMGTAKQISERIGKATIEINSISNSSSKGSSSTSQNTNLMGRDLFTPQELTLFKKGEGLYIRHSQHPYKTHLTPAYQWPIYKWVQEHEVMSIHSPRTEQDVNYFCPDDINTFTAAYELNSRGCMLDRYVVSTLAHLELTKDETYYENDIVWD